MKATLLIICMALTLTLSAQKEQNKIDLKATAGQYLIKSAKQKNNALLILGATTLLSGMVLLTDSKLYTEAGVISFIGTTISLSFVINSNNNLKKAGLKLE